MLSNDVVLDLDEENGTKNPSVNFRLTLAQLTEVTSFQEALYWSIFLQKKKIRCLSVNSLKLLVFMCCTRNF